MSWDPLSAVGSNEPLYFGPLAGYDNEELDRKGLEQDKKTANGFKGFSNEKSFKNDTKSKTKLDSKTLLSHPAKAWEEFSQTKTEIKSQNQHLEDTPTWDEFSRKTTFHGVRYIFHRSTSKIRRYTSKYNVSNRHTIHVQKPCVFPYIKQPYIFYLFLFSSKPIVFYC